MIHKFVERRGGAALCLAITLLGGAGFVCCGFAFVPAPVPQPRYVWLAGQTQPTKSSTAKTAFALEAACQKAGRTQGTGLINGPSTQKIQIGAMPVTNEQANRSLELLDKQLKVEDVCAPRIRDSVVAKTSPGIYPWPTGGHHPAAVAPLKVSTVSDAFKVMRYIGDYGMNH